MAAVRPTGIAAAIAADFVTIRDVNVERERRARRDGVECLGDLGGADVRPELGGGGIARVARHRAFEQGGMIGPHDRTDRMSGHWRP